MRLMGITFPGGQTSDYRVVETCDSKTLHEYLCSDDPGYNYGVTFTEYVDRADYDRLSYELAKAEARINGLEKDVEGASRELEALREQLAEEKAAALETTEYHEKNRQKYFTAAAAMFNWLMTHTSDEQYALLREMSDATSRIQRIKLVRTAFGCDLLMAKRIVEILADEYNYDF